MILTSGELFAKCSVRRVINSGVILSGLVSTLAGGETVGYEEGIGTAASFNAPSGLGITSSGILFLCDESNNRIRKILSSGWLILTHVF